MKTLVVGLGNPILSDDGVGVKVAHAVERRLPIELQDLVSVTEASVGGLRLMEMMIGYDRVLLIDALMPTAAMPPGTICRLTLEDLATITPTQHSASAHDTSLVTALRMGEKMGLPLPEEISIFAVTVENVLDFSEECTPAVDRAMPSTVEMVLAELDRILVP